MRKGRPGSSGIRSGFWCENKCTNLTPYSPYFSQADKLVNAYWGQLETATEPFLYESEPATGFIQPLTLADIKKLLAYLPEVFFTGLRGIFLCPGSKKQGKFSSIIYGSYSDFYRVIMIFPFPESMCLFYRTQPKPSVCHEYERHGAIWKKEGRLWKLEFSLEALRSFYIRDVLIHELGHHVDNLVLRIKNLNHCERFAEWFALEFGMRNPERELSEFGKVIQQIIKRTD